MYIYIYLKKERTYKCISIIIIDYIYIFSCVPWYMTIGPFVYSFIAPFSHPPPSVAKSTSPPSPTSRPRPGAGKVPRCFKISSDFSYGTRPGKHTRSYWKWP